jgi:hypothetical protein
MQLCNNFSCLILLTIAFLEILIAAFWALLSFTKCRLCRNMRSQSHFLVVDCLVRVGAQGTNGGAIGFNVEKGEGKMGSLRGTGVCGLDEWQRLRDWVGRLG